MPKDAKFYIDFKNISPHGEKAPFKSFSKITG
jgi:hypothetical protein